MTMIQNDLELKCTQERIAWFEGLVAQFRVSVPPENFPAMAEGYLAEIEKMHDEVMEYLKSPANQTLPAEAA
jgi:hypothetical protein